VFLNGQALARPDSHSEKITDDTFLLLFNAHHESLSFTLPGPKWGIVGSKCWIRRKEVSWKTKRSMGLGKSWGSKAAP